MKRGDFGLPSKAGTLQGIDGQKGSVLRGRPVVGSSVWDSAGEARASNTKRALRKPLPPCFIIFSTKMTVRKILLTKMAWSVPKKAEQLARMAPFQCCLKIVVYINVSIGFTRIVGWRRALLLLLLLLVVWRVKVER